MQSIFWTGFFVLSGFLLMGLAPEIYAAIRERREGEFWTKTLKLWCTTLQGVVATGGPVPNNQAIKGIRTLTNTGRKGVPANDTSSMSA